MNIISLVKGWIIGPLAKAAAPKKPKNDLPLHLRFETGFFSALWKPKGAEPQVVCRSVQRKDGSMIMSMIGMVVGEPARGRRKGTHYVVPDGKPTYVLQVIGPDQCMFNLADADMPIPLSLRKESQKGTGLAWANLSAFAEAEQKLRKAYKCIKPTDTLHLVTIEYHRDSRGKESLQAYSLQDDGNPQWHVAQPLENVWLKWPNPSAEERLGDVRGGAPWPESNAERGVAEHQQKRREERMRHNRDLRAERRCNPDELRANLIKDFRCRQPAGQFSSVGDALEAAHN